MEEKLSSSPTATRHKPMTSQQAANLLRRHLVDSTNAIVDRPADVDRQQENLAAAFRLIELVNQTDHTLACIALERVKSEATTGSDTHINALKIGELSVASPRNPKSGSVWKCASRITSLFS